PAAARGVGEAGVRLALLVHGEHEQAVAHDRARRPDVGLGEAAAVVAGAHVDAAVGVEVVVAAALPGRGLEGQLDAALELVATRAGHGVDDAAGAAPELDRIAAGLDLELAEERERRGREAVAAVEVGDVQAVDEDRVLGDRGAAEGDAAEGGVALDHARGQLGHRAQALLHRQAGDLIAGDVGGGLGGAHVHAVHDAVADDGHGAEVGDAALRAQVDVGGAAQAHADAHRRAHRLAAAHHLQVVVTHLQLAEAVAAVGAR